MRGIWIGAAAVVAAAAIALGILFWEGGVERREAVAPATPKAAQSEPGEKSAAGTAKGLRAPSDVTAPARPSTDSASSRSSDDTVGSGAKAPQPAQKQPASRQAAETETARLSGEAGAGKAVRETAARMSEPAPGIAADAGKPVAGVVENRAGETGRKMSALQPAPVGKAAAGMAPSFDVVRISQQCTAVIAGRAQPQAVVTVWDGDQPLGQVKADGNGEWVLVVDKPMRSGSRQLSLITEAPGQAPVQSASVVVVVVPDCAKSAPAPERGQAIAVLTPREGGASKVLQPPAPKGDTSKAKGLSLDSVDYDDKGEVVLSGRAKPGTTVRAYVNNQPVGEAKTNPEGEWRVKPSQPVDPGVHKLRIDQVAPEGEVVARVELPFSRADSTEVMITAGHVVVQPGNSLWRIARRTYGEGLKFTVIYQANKQNIADPDLIYPGQIFSLPRVN